jgi:hypothetical protein
VVVVLSLMGLLVLHFVMLLSVLPVFVGLGVG